MEKNNLAELFADLVNVVDAPFEGIVLSTKVVEELVEEFLPRMEVTGSGACYHKREYRETRGSVEVSIAFEKTRHFDGGSVTVLRGDDIIAEGQYWEEAQNYHLK